MAKKLQPVSFEEYSKMKKFSEMFETQFCTRCGGGGKFSYCQMYGDTCFKCGGSGRYFTKRGNEMKNAYLEQRKILVTDMEVGKRYHGFGYKFTVGSKSVDGDKITIVTADNMTLISYVSDNPKCEFIGLSVEERYQHYLNTFVKVKA